MRLPTSKAFMAAEHRSRLLEGMARAVAAKGYAATTIADIVREASVSRRTFYEQFFDKAACLVSLFEAASHEALKVLRAAIDPAHPWQTQVDHALGAYFQALAGNPVLLQTLYVEILGLGRAGLAARRRVNQEIAALMLEVVNGGAEKDSPLPRPMAMALVGAINELVMEYIEGERVPDLAELVAPAARLVRVVTSAFDAP
ncbi:MAG TPA: TetR/AcrR family transcriptional regulator [Ramlibacter sp.]|nr:TetR/AcrR family transcriptional regulator [Ramlibacter sp.]